MSCKDVWEDISDILRKASSSLNDKDPMISHPSFSLDACMSATELMDPKMDQCFGIAGGSVNVEELLNPPFPSSFDDKILIMLIKSLHIQEVAFLDGASLLESTHQCIYLFENSWNKLADESTNSPKSWFLSYVKSMSQCLTLVTKGVIDADVYEEEDFQTSSNNNIQETLDNDKVLEMLSKSLGDIERSESGKKIELLELFQLRSQLYNFFAKFRYIIDYSLKKSYQSRKTFQEAPKAGVPGDDNATDILLSEIASLSALAQDLEILLTTLKLMTATVSADESISTLTNVIDYENSSDISFAYNVMVGKLSNIVPIRHINRLSYEKSLEYLLTIAIEIKEICSTVSSIFRASYVNPFDIEYVMAYTMSISEKKYHLLSRSLFYSSIYFNNNDLSICLGSMRNYGIPLSLIQATLSLSGPMTVTDLSATINYLPTLSAVFWETIKVLCSHRNRVLPKLDSVLSSWGLLIYEANALDIKLRELLEIRDEKQQWFVYWTLIMSTQVMDIHLELLLEYNLLSKNEMDCFYYYWDYISTSRAIFMEKLRELSFSVDKAIFLDRLEHEIESIRNAKLSEVSSKIAKGKKSLKSMKAVKEAMSVIDSSQDIRNEALNSLILKGVECPQTSSPSFMETFLRARGQLSRGIFKLLLALSYLEVIDKAENDVMSWDWRFQMRYRAFLSIPNPVMLRYQDIIRHPTFETKVAEHKDRIISNEMDPSLTYYPNPVELLSSASQFCQNAKKLLDDVRKANTSKHDEIACQQAAVSMTKVAIFNSVTATKLTQSLSSCVASPGVHTSASKIRTFKKSNGELVTYNLPERMVLTIDRSLNKNFIAMNIKL